MSHIKPTMKLKSYQIKNYKSIMDTGVIELSSQDNVTVLAGQNESGKSSILRALKDYERDEFDEESRPYSVTETPIQSVTCEYSVGDVDDFFDELNNQLIDDHNIEVEDGTKVLDSTKIGRIKHFKITKTNNADNEVTLEIDDATFNIFKNAITNKIIVSGEGESATEVEEPHITFTDEQKSDVASLFWSVAPKIVFFDDFCDLLPDKILISDLKDKNTRKIKGYRAVKNLEQILEVNFVSKDAEKDAIRKTKEEDENNKVSINFQEDWGQRIHDENQVKVKYDFQKRDGEGEAGSYVNFFVETRTGELLSPKQRSKGLIWFLSLWMELKAQSISNSNLILLLDEPDQHLHVKAQQDVLKLVEKLSKTGNQIIYATHSPYLIDTEKLNRVNLVTNSKSDGTLVSSVLTTQIDTKKKVDALQPISDAIGLHTSLRPLGHKSVLLEGLSDFFYFSAMKKLLEKEGDFVFIPGIGVRKIENLISFCIGGGLSWVAVIDDDPNTGGTDSLKKFDEIKEHVFDGDEAETRKKIHILNGIVGIENMFTTGDLKLIDPQVSNDTDKVKAVGKKRKVLFSKMFFEKVQSKTIKKEHLSKTAISNFEKAFNFIDKNL